MPGNGPEAEFKAKFPDQVKPGFSGVGFGVNITSLALVGLDTPFKVESEEAEELKMKFTSPIEHVVPRMLCTEPATHVAALAGTLEASAIIRPIIK